MIICIFILLIIIFYFFYNIKKKTNSNDDIIFITSYRDIGRDKWTHMKRTNQNYYDWFNVLALNIKYKLVVFIDDYTKNKLLEVNSYNDNIEFRDLNEVNTFYDKYLLIEENIINSDIYKSKINNNIRPETWNAAYNLVNHSKINYVAYTKKLYTSYTFYSWIDFGYTRESPTLVPQNLIIEKIPKYKIILEYFKLPINRVNDEELLQINDTLFKASSFIIHTDLVEYTENKYNEKLEYWHINYICDDDESLLLQLYYDNPDKFYLIQDARWFSLYKHFI
jgi:hypothetical protein